MVEDATIARSRPESRPARLGGIRRERVRRPRFHTIAVPERGATVAERAAPAARRAAASDSGRSANRRSGDRVYASYRPS
jgi:hypothetical protein